MKFVSVNGVLLPQGRTLPGQQTKTVPISHKSSPVARNEVQKLDALLRGDLSVAIIRSRGGLGDMLMVTPLARAFKEKYPHCLLSMATDFEYAQGGLVELLKWNPYIDYIYQHNHFNREDYNLVAEVTGPELRFEVAHKQFDIRTDIWARLIGLPLKNGQGIYIVSPSEKAWAQEQIASLDRKKKMAVNIGVQIRSNDPKRSWPIKNLISLISYVNSIRSDVRWCLFDSEDHVDLEDLKNTVSFFGLKVRPTGALINEMDCFLGPDSGLMHLAGCLNKKMVVLFGNMPPASRIKYYPNAVGVTVDRLACLGCVYAACIHPTFRCMEDLDGARYIWPKIVELLGKDLVSAPREIFSEAKDPIVMASGSRLDSTVSQVKVLCL